MQVFQTQVHVPFLLHLYELVCVATANFSLPAIRDNREEEGERTIQILSSSRHHVSVSQDNRIRPSEIPAR